MLHRSEGSPTTPPPTNGSKVRSEFHTKKGHPQISIGSGPEMDPVSSVGETGAGRGSVLPCQNRLGAWRDEITSVKAKTTFEDGNEGSEVKVRQEVGLC